VDPRFLLVRQLPHLVEGDRDAFGMEEEVVLGEEPSKEHPVPVLVGALGRQVLELLPVVAAQRIAQLAPTGAKGHPELPLLCGERGGSLGGVDGEGAQGLLSSIFGDAPGFEDDFAELLAEVGMKGRHLGILLAILLAFFLRR